MFYISSDVFIMRAIKKHPGMLKTEKVCYGQARVSFK